MITREDYRDIRHRIQPGDVIAFSGRGLFSWIIQTWTRHPISHVGIVSRCNVAGGEESVRVMESTSLDGYTGVVETRLSQRVAQYRGAIFWLPLSFEIRNRLNLPLFWEFIYGAQGKPYDLWQAIRSATVDGKEDHKRLFCSELVAAGLEAGEALPEINSSGVTPRDICEYALYTPEVYQLCGRRRSQIPNLNTRKPGSKNNV